jgi:hypothetical protein
VTAVAGSFVSAVAHGWACCHLSNARVRITAPYLTD